MTMRTKLILAAIGWMMLGTALLLAGCASPPDISSMSSEQLRAAAADRSAGVSCAAVSTTLTSARVVYVLLDRGVSPMMQIEVQSDCSVKLKAGQ